MRKLVNKEEKCIFLGVSDNSKAYKLYNPSTTKIVISRDVVFDEKDTWLWNQNSVKENILVDFGDDEKGQQPMGNDQENEVTQNVPIVYQSPLTVESQKPQRVRRRPTWMTNYEVYKTKLKENGEVDKHKAHLVAKDCKQEFGVEYEEVFTSVARHDTIKSMIAMAAQNS
ncbi:hypothetical protein CK203_031384 [Vitis vinifera]|uniref:Uncharacterized protein n=1 Tax=Vitis vinifera TaxID=29760 RepID=A0A438I8Y9_VITVI|nr:hypothetical protein CK203_031384 [Vitis vinifera]